MDKIEQLKQQKQYEAYVKKKTPQHNVWFNVYGTNTTKDK